ncbi:MAG: hypothetical protein NNA22_05665 [Nitrospira sp.]|nr:hypothetical protein [Nitrospira sp.]
MTERLGRKKSERRAAVDAPAGSRKRYGNSRKLTPDLWDDHCPASTGARAGRAVRPSPCAVGPARTRQGGELLPQLYLHGMALGDFELTLEGVVVRLAPAAQGAVAGRICHGKAAAARYPGGRLRPGRMACM